MVERTVSHRMFSMRDQLRFAELSGDYNPIHVDEIAARRLLFGAPVAHGVHTLLWSMDRVCQADPSIRSFAELRAYFDAPAIVGEDVFLTWQWGPDCVLKGRVQSSRGNILRFTCKYSETATPLSIQPMPWAAPSCDEVEVQHLQGREGTEALILPPFWGEMFPNLAKQFSPSQVAFLLACTRIVGMKAPGQHSLFSALSFSMQGPSSHEDNDSVAYRVTSYDDRVKLVRIRTEGKGFSGELQAFYRPRPTPQACFSQLRELVRPGEFDGQNALVIGGSRGLGEIVSKLLMLGGAQVTLTFNRGRGDADRIVTEGQRLGFQAQALAFDVLGEKPSLAQAPTHVYYFATPKIPQNKSGRFDAKKFGEMLDIYVKGFADTLAWLQAQPIHQPCKLWFPSTAFLENREENFPEYGAAKLCAEAFANAFKQRSSGFDVFYNRLPKVATDQTQSLLDDPLPDAKPIMLDVIRSLA